MSDFHYNWGRGISASFIASLSEIHYDGIDNIPPCGACIMAANHISHFDPPIYARGIDRPVDYIALDAFYSVPLFGTLLLALNTCPFNREKTDRKAIRWAFERLHMGRLVGIFPERGIRHGKESVLGGAPMPVGTAALAQSAETPILPAIILGSDQIYQHRSWIKKSRVFVHYGKLIHPEAGETRESLNDRITSAWKTSEQFLISRHQIQPEELPRSAQDRWAEKERWE